jgi:hypothetical protein
MKKRLLISFLLIFGSIFVLNFGSKLYSVYAKSNDDLSANDFNVNLPLVVRSPEINPFGFESGVPLTDPTYKQRASELGGSWMRINRTVSWRAMQPVEGGPINWDVLIPFEEELLISRELGMKPIVVVDDFPDWATIVPNSCSPLKADKFDDYANFVVQLVNRYRIYEYNVKDWELGNEVDVDPSLVPNGAVWGCWGDIDDLEYYGGDYYGEMVKIVGQAIKQADPNARVWLGGLMVNTPNTTNPALGKPEHFLRGVLAVGAAPYFDVVPYHGHTAYYGKLEDDDSLQKGGWAPWGGGAVGKPRFIRSIMAEYGVDKVLSLDEVGVGCIDTSDYCNPPVTEFYQFQASMAVRYAVRVLSERVESFIWFTLNSPSWRNMGLVYDDQTPRPVYHAYQNLVTRTKGLTYSGMVNYGEGIEAHEFRSNSKVLQVIWTDVDENLIILIPQNKFIAAYDRDGNQISVGSNFQIIVGFAPVYLEYLP